MVKYLTEMAFHRKKVVKKMSDLNEEICDHILECLIYGNSLRCISHWGDEIGGFLSAIGRMEVKEEGKLKESEYRELIFDDYAEDVADIEVCLYLIKTVRSKKKGYPDFEITEELVNNSYRLFNEVRDSIPKMLADKKINHTQNEYKELVLGFVSKYIGEN